MNVSLPKKLKPWFIGCGLLLLGWILGAVFSGIFTGRGVNPEPAGPTVGGAATIWTCSMHPQIQQPKPGKCPICAMDLIPLTQSSVKKTGPRQLAMSEAAKRLAQITTVPVERKLVEAEIRLVGKVAFDETLTKTVAAYFPARVDRLYVDFTGIEVRRDDHLAQVYSPDLLTAQTELLTALKFGNHVSIARDKLRLWGFSDERILSIEKSGKTSDRLDIDTPLGGIVISKHVNEGDYVTTGQPLFMIADLSKVWVQLDAYESDLPWLRFGQSVTFEAEAIPGRIFEGTVSFVAPVMDPKTRTIKVRVNVENPALALKPDMFVHASIKATLAGAGKVIAKDLAGKWISPMHPEVVRDEPGTCPVCGMDLVKAEELGYIALDENQIPPLVVPSSAVLRTGRRSVVYVEVPDSDKPTYEGRQILVGPRAGDYYLVEEGLMEGERVVVKGNFKIDSALQIVAKPSMMDPDGGGGGGGHDHGGKAKRVGVGMDMMTYEVSPEFRSQIGEVYRAYLEVQKSLVASNLKDSQSRAGKIVEALALVDMNLLKDDAHMDWMNQLAPIRGSAELIVSAGDLEVARTAFATLSKTLILTAHVFGAPLDEALGHVNCPMAFNNKGADWLQIGEEIRNPYFGEKMLNCGSIKATIQPESGEVKRYEADPKFEKQIGVAVKVYDSVRAALAADDLEKAKTESAKLSEAFTAIDMALLVGDAHMAWMKDLEPLTASAAEISKAKDIDAARSSFERLSDALTLGLRHFKAAGFEEVYIAHCPMAFDKKGANWLQLDKEIRNPYFGSKMLKCGSITEILIFTPKAAHDHGEH